MRKGGFPGSASTRFSTIVHSTSSSWITTSFFRILTAYSSSVPFRSESMTWGRQQAAVARAPVRPRPVPALPPGTEPTDDVTAGLTSGRAGPGHGGGRGTTTHRTPGTGVGGRGTTAPRPPGTWIEVLTRLWYKPHEGTCLWPARSLCGPERCSGAQRTADAPGPLREEGVGRGAYEADPIPHLSPTLRLLTGPPSAASQTAKPGVPEKRGASPQGALRGSDTLGPLSPESTPFGAERHGHREHHTHAVRPHVAVSLGRARHDAGSPARSSVSRGGCAGRQAGRGPVPKTRCLEKILLPPSGPAASARGGRRADQQPQPRPR